jgi:hypothetical protein
MSAKARKRSVPKQTPECQCQQQTKDILRRLEVLEATALTTHSLQLKGFTSEDSPSLRFALVLPTYLDSRKRIRKPSR